MKIISFTFIDVLIFDLALFLLIYLFMSFEWFNKEHNSVYFEATSSSQPEIWIDNLNIERKCGA